MNIYLVEQDIHNDYDTYDAFIVVCETEQEARNTHPSKYVTHHKDGKWYGTRDKLSKDDEGYFYETENDFPSWVLVHSIDKVKVTLIGKAEYGIKTGVILSSFNAG